MLTLRRLKTVLRYDPDSGSFFWLIRTSNRIKVGDEAGVDRSDGYIIISIDGVKYLAHRLAWFYMTGEWPKEQIDHKNLDRSDTRWGNLREAARAENYRNTGCRSHSKIGLKGVTTNGARWQAQIRINKKRIYLGTYDSPEQAHAAYCAANTLHHGEFGRTA